MKTGGPRGCRECTECSRKTSDFVELQKAEAGCKNWVVGRQMYTVNTYQERDFDYSEFSKSVHSSIYPIPFLEEYSFANNR